MSARNFSRVHFETWLAFVSGRVQARDPAPPYLMTSDVAWQFPGSDPKNNLRLWFADTEIVAYAWFQPPDHVHFDWAPVAEPLVDEMVSWLITRRQAFDGHYPFFLDCQNMSEWASALIDPPDDPRSVDRYLFAGAFADDPERRKRLVDLGFEATEHVEPHLSHDLRTAIDTQPFAVRAVAADELNARVALHRAAWAPASGFSLQRYQAVRAMAPIYDGDLDLIAVSESGDFASYTIAWCDGRSRVGAFEPFGTHPDYRGSGASEAVLLTGLAQLAGRGMQRAQIYTAGFNHQAQHLYRRCGFETQCDKRTYALRL